MTEGEWLDCTDPHAMFVFLDRYGKDRKMRLAQTSRKWRLLCCGCCRQVWHLLVEDDSRGAVDAAERFADGFIKKSSLKKHYLQANWVLQRVEADDVTPLLKVMAAAMVMCTAHPGACNCDVEWYDDEMNEVQRAQKAHFLRDIIGNPFRPVTIAPTWLSWNNGTTVLLAQAIYNERELPSGHLDVGRLAILGDALEDAGCDNADILDHCRQPGEHVRGCWVVDLLLGKQ
jgi:hypothetical protein